MAAMKQSFKYQNTYRLESKNPFNSEQVEVILKNVMDKQFSQFERFDTQTSVALCKMVTDEIINQIKEKNFDRYKIIVVITICEKFMQGMNYSQKSLWDPTTDSSVTYIYDSPNFTAIGICYALYYE
ncbi:CLUMA_CG020265, isoform A [Clunio marinus]|uniref:CLUMA_CG020265, isoform A n=1 Tax=Clunio marinus TaxID=568069 RepID=A0A1J1J740_9DIPT|nr:CLUMA_CG020265, isoform A [Clunio marinus]